MDASELAFKMLEWEKLRRALDILARQIKGAVIELGATQKVGNVTASYSGGRRKFDYKTAANNPPWFDVATVEKFTTIIPQAEAIDWKAVCECVGVKEIPFTKSAPSVTIKLRSS